MPKDPATWAALLLAAGCVGFAKTAISGMGTVAVVMFAAVLPARDSTGALLPLLICGDALAVAYYRRHADWGDLWRLMPGVAPGLVLGAWFVALVDDTWMRRSIGLILLVLCAAQLWSRRSRPTPPETRSRARPALTALAGIAAGFATMAANAAGPVMTLYLIMGGLSVMGVLGTGAWFFALVNLAKLPFSVGLELVSPISLVMDAWLAPALLAGAVLGAKLVPRMDRRAFESAALALSAASAAALLA